jgi:hypothetical protein
MLTFIETPLFQAACERYLSDDEYAELQGFLCDQPDAGRVVPGSGGVRKLRWNTADRGKQGGLRVLYYLRLAADQIVMVMMYSKNVRENVPARLLRQIKEECERGQEDGK